MSSSPATKIQKSGSKLLKYHSHGHEGDGASINPQFFFAVNYRGVPGQMTHSLEMPRDKS